MGKLKRQIKFTTLFGELALVVEEVRENLRVRLKPDYGAVNFGELAARAIEEEMYYAGLSKHDKAPHIGKWLYWSMTALNGFGVQRLRKEGKLPMPITETQMSAKLSSSILVGTDPFYELKEWRMVRYIALSRSKKLCELCGASPSPGKPLHVDHIKPRSKFPALQLDVDNLQVLCIDCNLGKSNRDCIDWRR